MTDPPRANVAAESRVGIPAPKPVELHAIVNPRAGGGRAGRVWPRFAIVFAHDGIKVHEHRTREPGHARSIAQQLVMDRVTELLVVGGDGTINEAVSGMLDQCSNAPSTTLSILPVGTGRDFARGLGLTRFHHTRASLLNGTIEQLDVGEICFDGEAQRRWFINIADAGIGALVARRANRTSKAGGGFLTYLAGALREIASFQPFSARVVADGVLLHDGACASIVVCNGAFHGGGMRPAPDASPIDGMLDAVLLKALTRRALAFNVLPRVYFGSHVNHPAVTCVRAQTLRIEADDPIPLALDGENAGAFTRLCVAVVPGVLRVRVPRRLCKV